MGWFSRKADTEQIARDLAADIPDDLSDRQINHVLVTIAEEARQEYSSEQADAIAGATYRAYLVKTGQAWRYPELFR